MSECGKAQELKLVERLQTVPDWVWTWVQELGEDGGVVMFYVPHSEHWDEGSLWG